jgi:hypothetical protein
MVISETTYQALLQSVKPVWVPEPYAVVKSVEAHRDYWKPDKTKILLIAESHVYTTLQDNAIQVQVQDESLPGLPTDYVKLVYCLGYGGQDVLNRRLPYKHGTPQYWRLFNICNQFDGALSIGDLTKVSSKITLLKALKSKGIWLFDVCPMALYGVDPDGLEIKKQMSAKKYSEIIQASWQFYSRPIFEQMRPPVVIVVGKMLWSLLSFEMQSGQADWVYQPNAFRGKGYDTSHAPEAIASKIKSLMAFI